MLEKFTFVPYISPKRTSCQKERIFAAATYIQELKSKKFTVFHVRKGLKD